MPNELHYGDNLAVMRGLKDESVDLIYLDPPFNSNATYNVLFRSPSGTQSQAQIEAFEDTWHWNIHAEEAFDEVMKSSYTDAAELLRAMRAFLHENDMMAYLTNICVRLIEMHRLLKKSGSLFLHCDPTASHYLKLLLDAVFGADRMTNEIIWQRTNTRGHAFTRFPSTHDVIFFFRKSDDFVWHTQYLPHSESYIKSHYSNIEPETGRRYTLGDCLNPNPDRPNLTYEWNGHLRDWRWTKEKMQELHDAGRLHYTSSGMPRYKRYLDEMPGTAINSVWADIFPINSQAQERLGYPTQKPVALLERIISAASNEGDIVLDPFCGCGTTIHAAQKLKRNWIGIDITHLAIGLIQRRLKDAFGPEVSYEIHGTPKDLDGARALAAQDKYQFQWWAVSLVDAVPYGRRRKGADRGIDGHVYFRSDANTTEKAIVSVKGGGVGVKDIRELIQVVNRENAKIGLFISLENPTGPMRKEAAGAGFYESPFSGKFPKIQLFTIEELFAGKKPAIPLIDTSSFRKAAAEQTGEQGRLL